MMISRVVDWSDPLDVNREAVHHFGQGACVMERPGGPPRYVVAILGAAAPPKLIGWGNSRKDAFLNAQMVVMGGGL